MSTSVRLPNCLGPPRVERLLVRPTEGVDYGSRPRPLCGDGCVKAGREGLRPHRRPGSPQTVETVRTWAATTNAVLALREHLVEEQVSLVVMEATGDYWKPFYYLLEDA